MPCSVSRREMERRNFPLQAEQSTCHQTRCSPWTRPRMTEGGTFPESLERGAGPWCMIASWNRICNFVTPPIDKTSCGNLKRSINFMSPSQPHPCSALPVEGILSCLIRLRFHTEGRSPGEWIYHLLAGAHGRGSSQVSHTTCRSPQVGRVWPPCPAWSLSGQPQSVGLPGPACSITMALPCFQSGAEKERNPQITLATCSGSIHRITLNY